MDSYNSFINSDIYNKAVQTIVDKLDIKIDQNFIKIKQIEMNFFEKANLTIAEIKDILENDFERVIKFVLLKMDRFKNNKDNGGDFSKNENISKEDQPTTIKILPYYNSFLLRYLIEFYFLKMEQNKLLQYIKDIRIPQPNKYVKELKDIYNQIK